MLIVSARVFLRALFVPLKYFSWYSSRPDCSLQYSIMFYTKKTLQCRVKSQHFHNTVLNQLQKLDFSFQQVLLSEPQWTVKCLDLWWDSQMKEPSDKLFQTCAAFDPGLITYDWRKRLYSADNNFAGLNACYTIKFLVPVRTTFSCHNWFVGGSAWMTAIFINVFVK